jgi:hypothetical protein
MKLSRHHRVVLIGEAKGMGGAGRKAEGLCKDHGQAMCAYDVECQRMVCGLCLGVGEHIGHKCQRLEDVQSQVVGEMGDMMNEVKAGVEMYQHKQQLIEGLKSKIEQMAKDAETDIAAYFAKVSTTTTNNNNNIIDQLDKNETVLSLLCSLQFFFHVRIFSPKSCQGMSPVW